MRQRESFIVTAVFLGVLLWIIQLVPINWRYLAIFSFSLITYLACAFSLRKFLKFHHFLTFLPIPALYSLSIGSYYFLLPTNFWSMITILGLFSIGMYALLLSGNIFIVAQHNKVIQLVHAAQNIVLYTSIIISLLGVQIIFTFDWPFYVNFLLVLALHFPLCLAESWSVNLTKGITWELFQLSFFSALIVSEIALVLSFLPLAAWSISLLVMSTFYLILGILQVFISEKLYRPAISEYLLLTIFIIILYIVFFPGK